MAFVAVDAGEDEAGGPVLPQVLLAFHPPLREVHLGLFRHLKAHMTHIQPASTHQKHTHYGGGRGATSSSGWWTM